MAEMVTSRLLVNGEEHEVLHPVHHTLLEVLRERLGLTGTKHGCELGECGACTVLVDGEPVLACLLLAVDAEGTAIETVESLAREGELHPLQRTFADLGAAQCGYCTPGILMSARHLLEQNPDPDTAAVKEALSGNICRCTGYWKIIEAVKWAGGILRGDETARPPAAAFFGESTEEEGGHHV